ncbi:GNAT family N-acetyltransferase [Streptomyces sp. NPDC085639]|uniref:GNAT family N-acetyltransferase n=1 Tax=Streptomyces sp. NPDC085639 TaxID=3365734 RepID=UPI0037D1CDEE
MRGVHTSRPSGAGAGDAPFLHTAASNTTAIRLYESIGFTLRRRPSFMAVRAPGNTAANFS